MYLRVNGVQYDVYHVGYEVDVGLASAAAALLAERCVVGKAPEEQLEVVHAQHVGRVANAGGLEQVAVVSGERVGEERLAHVRSPNGQYAVALRVGVLQRGVLPLFAARARRTDGVRVVVDVHEVDVSDGGVADALARLGLEQRLELGLLAVRVDGEHLLRMILVALAAYAAHVALLLLDLARHVAHRVRIGGDQLALLVGMPSWLSCFWRMAIASFFFSSFVWLRTCSMAALTLDDGFCLRAASRSSASTLTRLPELNCSSLCKSGMHDSPI